MARLIDPGRLTRFMEINPEMPEAEAIKLVAAGHPLRRVKLNGVDHDAGVS